MLKNKVALTHQVLIFCYSLLLASNVAATDTGLVESTTGFNINKTDFIKKLGLSFDGWVEAGFSINPDDPSDGFNTPVTFNDQANEFNLHQLYVIMKRDVDDLGDAWDIGFRTDLLYGSDARFTIEQNFENRFVSNDILNFYKLSLPQVYLDIFAPIGNGLTVSIGNFYTVIGKEEVMAPENFFFSLSYIMQYSEPFIHTGVLLKYPVNANLKLAGGVVAGWDSFLKEPANFLGNIQYVSDDGSASITASLITGPANRNNKQSNKSEYSLVFEYDITQNFHYTLEHDFGIEENLVKQGTAAKWYGIDQYFIYDISKSMSMGLRTEWFRDEDGVRVAQVKNNYFAFTGGLNWFAYPWLTIRPEVRYDIATNKPVYNAGKSKDQFLFSVDAIMRF